jgi:hypothetical protein
MDACCASSPNVRGHPSASVTLRFAVILGAIAVVSGVQKSPTATPSASESVTASGKFAILNL